VDFDALDGGLTHLFFVLGLKFDELYLPWLHKLSQMFAYKDAVMAIINAPDAASIFQAVAAAERRLEPEARIAHR
jgi:mannitol/fructose-specific phosphotransferase system IIA component (Ntr-type)